MLVMWTGSPPPSWERLEGVVYGVNESFDALGNGTDVRNDRGPAGPSIPCDSPNSGRLFTTRQINSPSDGRLVSKPFLRRFSSRKYSLPSGRTRILINSLGDSSIAPSISFCGTVGSMVVALA